MKIVEKIAEKQAQGKPYYSFEYFPPKTALGLSNLFDRIGRMQSLSPSFVTCTWGAGGSTFEKTTELCAVAQTVHGLETCMHLTCTNMDRGKVDEALKQAKDAGIQNILALRGDPPRGQEYWTQVDDSFVHAIDLVRYIRQQYGDYFCIGVAGYPEGHMDCLQGNSIQEIEFLKEKVDAGADFVLTQLFYDVDGFLCWEKKCRQLGIKVPIIPGIMPIQSYNGFRRITNLAKIFVPQEVVNALEPIKADDQKIKDYGVKLASAMIQKLQENGTLGFHICTLNLEKSVRLILEAVGFVPVSSRLNKRGLNQQAQQTAPSFVIENIDAQSSNSGLVPAAIVARRKSISDGTQRSLDPAIQPRLNPNSTATDSYTTGRNESWDDFPNGRWGDARSPAFGDLDGYGVSLKVEPTLALQYWKTPQTVDDISKLFVEFIQGTIPALPWSEESPLAETSAIQDHLVKLNKQGLWTVGSQPAVDGISSTDELVGWGPIGGYVYQKAFLEMFVEPSQLIRLVEKFKQSPWITFFAASRDGKVVTNTSGSIQGELDRQSRAKSVADSPPSPAETEEQAQARQPLAVTWGVFPDKEIVQPTVIEQVSFLAWRDEAFEIWREWEHLYPKDSTSQKLLNKIGNEYWLVNVVHNDYRDANGIWDAILS